MPRRICPVCKSDRVRMHAGGHTGLWQCRNCVYVGALIVEED